MKLIDYIKEQGIDTNDLIKSLSVGYTIRYGHTEYGVNHQNIKKMQARILVCKALTRVELKFEPLKSTQGGFFNPSKNTIVINSNLMTIENRSLISEILAHEFTHVLQFSLNQDAFEGYVNSNCEDYKAQWVEREAFHYAEQNRAIWRPFVKRLLKKVA